MLFRSENVTLSKEQTENLTNALESAARLLEKDAIGTDTYPDNLILDLGFITCAENEDHIISILKSSMDHLPYSQKSLLILKYREGLSIEAIAREHHITESSCISMLKETTAALSRKISKKLKDLGLSEENNENKKSSRNGEENAEKKGIPRSEDICALGLSPRSANALKRAGIRTVGDLNGRSLHDLKMIKGLGDHSLNEVLKQAAENGIKIKQI